MSEIINLSRARKARRRKAEVEQAAANRLKFGRTKAERERQSKDAARQERELGGSQIDRSSDD